MQLLPSGPRLALWLPLALLLLLVPLALLLLLLLLVLQAWTPWQSKPAQGLPCCRQRPSARLAPTLPFSLPGAPGPARPWRGLRKGTLCSFAPFSQRPPWQRRGTGSRRRPPGQFSQTALCALPLQGATWSTRQGCA